MQDKKIDILNLVLVVLSFWLAREFPYGLFLFAYAILGPVHYLTEVNWIKEKRFFFKSSSWPIMAILCSIALSFPFWSSYLVTFFDLEAEGLLGITSLVTQFSFVFLIIPLTYTLDFGGIDRWKLLSIIVVLTCGVAYLTSGSLLPILIGTLIPTVVHVYFFTLIFMLYGARKSESPTAYLPILGVVVCSVCIFVLPVRADLYSISDTVKSEFIANGFYKLNTKLREWIEVSDGSTFYFYEEFELRIQMFLSFAYTYHYFNWFVKTSVIGWHKKMNYRKTVLIIFVWAVSLTAFAYDYALGVAFTIFLSYIHVILEFPLNVMSIKSLLLTSNRKIE